MPALQGWAVANGFARTLGKKTSVVLMKLANWIPKAKSPMQTDGQGFVYFQRAPSFERRQLEFFHPEGVGGTVVGDPMQNHIRPDHGWYMQKATFSPGKQRMLCRCSSFLERTSGCVSGRVQAVT